MSEEIKDDNIELESSPVQDEEVSDSSTEETEASQSEEATSTKATADGPFNEHPRFKELIEEKNEYREQLRQMQQQLLDVTRPKETEQDPYAGKTAEEVQFWQQVEKIAERKAAAERKKAESEIQAVRNEYGKIAANQFLSAHPDVPKGSQELKDIVKTAQELGGNLEAAYKVVMFDSNAQRKVEEVKKSQLKKTKEKMAANVETKSLPVGAIKAKDDLSFADTFNKAFADIDSADMEDFS